MPSPFDRFDPVRLAAVAERVRTSRDITSMPPLKHFNSTPCDEHAELGDPSPFCKQCGIKLRRHQRVAIMWLWLVRKGLIADPTGSGKTAIVAGLFSILSQTNELGRSADGVRVHGRALVICEPSAMRQWQRELKRMVPRLTSEIAEGTQRQRSERYAMPWDILIIGHQMLLRDAEVLRNLGITILVADDVDPLRHSETKTASAIKRLGQENPNCSRIVLLNATPLQKRLLELYDTLSQIGGYEDHRLGRRSAFERRYLIKEPTEIWTPGRGRNRAVKRRIMQVVGHRYIEEFQERIAPMVLRRTLAQIDDVELPSIQPENVWLSLHPNQRAAYEELQQGALQLVRGGRVDRIAARNKLMAAQQICEGLSVLGADDGPGSSVKFDWLMNKLTGDWSGESEDDPGEKVVVFVQFKNGIRSLSSRMTAASVGFETIWGEDRSPKNRDAAMDRFWNDPACRVLLGTSAIEKSLNLQVARHLVNVDQLPNPARMTQLAGRVRRQGSRFRTVYVHNLLTVDTHEERTLAVLEHEAALSSVVWQEESQLFNSLSPLQLMTLIDPRSSRYQQAS